MPAGINPYLSLWLSVSFAPSELDSPKTLAFERRSQIPLREGNDVQAPTGIDQTI
jgi:hypothetical protein